MLLDISSWNKIMDRVKKKKKGTGWMEAGRYISSKSKLNFVDAEADK